MNHSILENTSSHKRVCRFQSFLLKHEVKPVNTRVVKAYLSPSVITKLLVIGNTSNQYRKQCVIGRYFIFRYWVLFFEWDDCLGMCVSNFHTARKAFCCCQSTYKSFKVKDINGTFMSCFCVCAVLLHLFCS